MLRAAEPNDTASRPLPPPSPATVALPWYEAEDWPVLHSMFLERDSVPDSYERWLLRALEAERRYTVDGYKVVRVVVRPEALLEWCTAQGRVIDLKARHDYAQSRLEQIAF